MVYNAIFYFFKRYQLVFFLALAEDECWVSTRKIVLNPLDLIEDKLGILKGVS